MQLKRPRNKFATKRANTLRAKEITIIRAPRTQRLSLGSPLKEKKGYDFLPSCKPVYTNELIRDLRNRFVGLTLAGKLKVPKLRGDYDVDSETLFEIERQVHLEHMSESEVEGFYKHYHAVDAYNEYGKFKAEAQLQGLPCLVVEYRCKSEGNCFLLRPLFSRPNQKLLYAFALMEAFLGVYTWEQMGVDEDVEMTIEYQMSGWELDEETGEQCQPVTNWRSSGRSMGLTHIQESVRLSEVNRCERNWQIAHIDVMNKFRKTLLETPISKVEKWITAKDDAALFLKGVLYLLVHKFQLYHYIDHKDNEDYRVPVDKTFGFSWDYDAYAKVNDEWLNCHYEGGLGALTLQEYYFECGVLKVPGKNHLELMELFTDLFNYDIYKRKFNEKNKRIQTKLHALHLQQWTGVLHRAIERYRSESAKRLETNERRVYP